MQNQMTAGPSPGEIDAQYSRAFSGVMTGRVMAYLVDFVIILFLSVFLFTFVGILGLVTFGLGWKLMGLVGPATGVIYCGLTIGGRHHSTWGMRMFGMRVMRADGTMPGFLVGAVHALLFYVSVGTLALWLLDVIIGLARRDRRLGRDLLLDLVVVNRSALRLS